jgi:hypothetical protein
MKKIKLITTAAAGAFAFLAFAEPKPQIATQSTTYEPTLAEAATLADACRLTQLMNEDKWDDLETALGTKEGMIATLRPHASLKVWLGSGAYRGTRVDTMDPLRGTHRFGFAPRSNPHEIWLSYTVSDTSKPSLMVMGW